MLYVVLMIALYSIIIKGLIPVNQIFYIKQTLICKLKNQFENLIYFLHRLPHHIQDKALYIMREC